MSTSESIDIDEADHSRLTLIFRGTDKLTFDLLANDVYEVTDGDCDVYMREYILYVEIARDEDDGWTSIPALVSTIRRHAPNAELVRVETVDALTAAQRTAEPLTPAKRGWPLPQASS